jgi:hypothetical protein
LDARVNPLPRWQSWMVIGSAISLLASGALWQIALLRHELPTELDPWLARWHGLSSMAGVFAFGIVASKHIPRGLFLRKRSFSGITLTSLFALLALSGFALAYLVPEPWHARVGWAHSALGVLAFGLGALHRR